jgi:pectinesterase
MKTRSLAVALGLIALTAQAQTISPLTVAADGSGQFRTVQAAIDAVPNQSAVPIIIQLKSGIYHEKVVVPTLKTHLVLRGDDAASTIITYSDHSGANGISTPTSYSVLVQAADFTAENVTFENAAGYTAGQAVALHVEADHAAVRPEAAASITKTVTLRALLISSLAPALGFLTTALSKARKIRL